MGKLFDLTKDLEGNLDTSEDSDVKLDELRLDNVGMDITAITESLEVAAEGFRSSYNELFNVRDIQASLDSKNRSSNDYFLSIENFNLVLKVITKDFGLKHHIPSMEDFKNPYATETCHQVVMEGFKEFLVNIWERIKKFFKDFWKKLTFFFKRLANANLELEQYEKYIERMMTKVRKSTQDPKSTLVDSKLPELFCSLDEDEFKIDKKLRKMVEKIKLLSEVTKEMLEEHIPDSAETLETLVDEISDLQDPDDMMRPVLVEQAIETLNSIITNSISSTFGQYEARLKDLSDEVVEELASNSDDTLSSKSKIVLTSLVKSDKDETLLPGNLNCYFAIIGEENNDEARDFITIGTKNLNKAANRMIKTITTKEDMEYLYKEYTSLYRNSKFNYDRLILSLDNRFGKAFDEFETIFKHSLENHDETGANQPNMDDMLSGLNGASIDRANAEVEYQQSTSGEDKHLFGQIKLLQEIIFRFIKFLQKYIHTLSSNFVATEFSCRYELVKYLYQSAKTF